MQSLFLGRSTVFFLQTVRWAMLVVAWVVISSGLMGPLGSTAQIITTTPIFEVTQEWRYYDMGTLDGVDWATPAFDDSVWPSGPGLLYVETNEMVMPRNTELVLGANTYYFRTHFYLEAQPRGAYLVFSNLIDDGAVFYLNGAEVQRLQMPPIPAKISYSTLATDFSDPISGDATTFSVFSVRGEALTNLLVGDNVIGVEVHQVSQGSSDIAFGSALSLVFDPSSFDPLIRWGAGAGGGTGDDARGVAVDRDGNAFVVGSFTGSIAFGSSNLVARGGTDGFLAKYRPDGQREWVQQIGSKNTDSAEAVATDDHGNVYVTGRFSGELLFGGTNLIVPTSIPVNSHYVMKFSNSGEIKWAHSGDGISSRLDVDDDGNAYVAGQFSGAAKIGDFHLVGTNGLNVSVAKYNSEGRVLWARSGGGNSLSVTAPRQSIGIAVARDGGCFVTTTFNSIASFGGITVTNQSRDDIFLARYSNEGEPLWVRQIAGGVRNQEHGVAVDDDGNAFVAGTFQGNAGLGTAPVNNPLGLGLLVAKYNDRGDFLWVQQLAGTNSARAVRTDAAGNVIVAGSFLGTNILAETTLVDQGGGDTFVAKISADGSPVWLKRWGGKGADVILGLDVDRAGGAAFAGSFSDVFYFGDHSLISKGGTDMFVVRVGSGAIPTPSLEIALNPASLVLSWNKTVSTFQLESAASLSQPVWEVVTTPAVTVGDRFEVAMSKPVTTRFFRLRSEGPGAGLAQ